MVTSKRPQSEKFQTPLRPFPHLSAEPKEHIQTMNHDTIQTKSFALRSPPKCNCQLPPVHQQYSRSVHQCNECEDQPIMSYTVLSHQMAATAN